MVTANLLPLGQLHLWQVAVVQQRHQVVFLLLFLQPLFEAFYGFRVPHPASLQVAHGVEVRGLLAAPCDIFYNVLKI